MAKPTSNSLEEWTDYVHSGATYDIRVARLAEAPSAIRLLLGPGKDDRDMSQKIKAEPVQEKLRIVFAWPDRKLNPNSRTHWAERARVAKRYRFASNLHAKQQLALEAPTVEALRKHVAAGGHLDLFLHFRQPNRRRRDDDNLVAAFKPARDGLADALGIDDQHFRIHPVIYPPSGKRKGSVAAVISPGSENPECRKAG